MAPLLNELLEEAASECMRLSEESKETAETVGQLVEHGESLIQGVVAEGERAYRGLEVLAETLIESDRELQTAVEQPLRTALHHVMERAQEVRAQSGQLQDRVRDGVAHLAEERSVIEKDLQARVETTSTHFQRVSESMGELQQLAADRLQITRTAISGLQQAVEQGRDTLDQATERLIHELEEAQATSRAQALNYTVSIQTLVKDQTFSLIELGNAMIRAHNKAVTDLRTKFTETIPAALTSAAGDLKTAMDALKQLCEDRTEPLQTRSQDIVKVVGDAVGALERIRSAAASAGALDI